MNYKLLISFFILFSAFCTKYAIADKPQGLAILPEDLQLEVVSTPNKEVLLIWRYKNVHQVKNFFVERSSDGINFTRIGEISCTGDSLSSLTYEFKDNNPDNCTNYYRLALINEETVQFAQTEMKAIAVLENISFNLFPNPAQDMLQVRAVGELSERYEVHVYSPMGYLVRSLPIQTSSGIYTKYIDIKDLSAGLYVVKVLRDNYSVSSSVFIKQ